MNTYLEDVWGISSPHDPSLSHDHSEVDALICPFSINISSKSRSLNFVQIETTEKQNTRNTQTNFLTNLTWLLQWGRASVRRCQSQTHWSGCIWWCTSAASQHFPNPGDRHCPFQIENSEPQMIALWCSMLFSWADDWSGGFRSAKNTKIFQRKIKNK